MALPEAVIFDMDGLLVDTETCDYESWRELHAAHGQELLVAEFCENAGLYGTWDRMYGALSQVCGISPEALQATREPRFRELVDASLCPSPALLGLFQDLRTHGIARGLASSSDRDWVHYLLDGLGITAEFAVIATGHDVARRKPAPDLYLLATERLGADPARCVALEDSSHGLAAARAAGLRTIAIPNAVSRHQDLSQAHVQVEHFGNVTLDLLRRLMQL